MVAGEMSVVFGTKMFTPTTKDILQRFDDDWRNIICIVTATILTIKITPTTADILQKSDGGMPNVICVLVAYAAQFTLVIPSISADIL